MTYLLERSDGSSCELLIAQATGFFERLRGLLGRAAPARGTGLWIEPCSAVHSFGMRYAIDLVFVDRRGRVLATRPRLGPHRAAACRGARATVELAAGEVARLRIHPGARLVPIPTRSAVTAEKEEAAMKQDAATKQDPATKQEAIAKQEATAKQEAVVEQETVITHRRSSRPARAAAIAAVAAASMISGTVRAGAMDNMNLGYEFLDEAGGDQLSSVPANAGPSGSTESTVSPATGPAAPESGTDAKPASASRSPATALDAAAFAARLAEAEGFYRNARYDEAQRAFADIVAADPGHAHAWLRIGNLLHRKRDWFDALSAYRKAARPQADVAIREKAVYNIALLNLELARHALRRLEKLRTEAAGDAGDGAPRQAGVSDASLRQLSDQLGNAYASVAAARRSDSAVPSAVASSSVSPTDVPTRGGRATAPAPGTAEAPAPGPRTPKPLPAEKPVEVEIRQGGGAQ